MTSPLISVVMVTHNHQAFVRDALLALFQQSYADEFQIVVSDDASTDGTDQEIRKFAQLAPPNIQIVRLLGKKRIGALRNFNRALRHCNGRYIVIADGDDVSAVDRLATISSELKKSNRSLFISGLVDLESHLPHTASTRLRNECFGAEIVGKRKLPWPILGASFAFDARLISKSPGIDTLYATNHNADHTLFWRAMAENGCCITTKNLVEYRDHSQGVSLRRAEAAARDEEDWASLFQIHLKRSCNAAGNAIYAADMFLSSGWIQASLQMRKQAFDQVEAIIRFLTFAASTLPENTPSQMQKLHAWMRETLTNVKSAMSRGESSASAMTPRDRLIWTAISESGNLDMQILEPLLDSAMGQDVAHTSYLKALVRLRKGLLHWQAPSPLSHEHFRKALTPHICERTITYRGRSWPLSLAGLKRLPKKDLISAIEQLQAREVCNLLKSQTLRQLMSGQIGKSRAILLLCGGRLAALNLRFLSFRDRVKLLLTI